MDITGLIIFLAIGAVAGWLAGTLMKGGGFGLVGNIAVGIVGAVIGGFVFDLLGISAGGLIGSIITATAGAAILLFAISVVGIFLNRKNVVILLMAIELMLLAVNMNFVAFSHYLSDTAGQVFVFFILTVAAAEAAIGLAILIVLFRNRNTINVEDLDSLKG